MRSEAGRRTGDPSAGIRSEVLAGCRRAVGTPARRRLLALTLVLGVLATVLVAAGTPSGERTFALISAAVQSLMSITVPFLGVLLVRDLRRPGGGRIAPTLLAAAIVAAAVAVFGILVCAVATAVAPSDAADGRWHDAAVVVIGSVLVQLVAQSVGTGLGLLLPSPAIAMVGSIVLPLGLWLLLGTVDDLRPAREWLTPYASVQHAFSGRMTLQNWIQWGVVMLLWGVGSNAVGAIRLSREGQGING